ncbi:Pyrophosphate--fructose 6-phosphate 1-phosphotransferase [Methyloligella halotolerans]|uniref:Pyrophosphate--fructose 6-phosphate 1-phosphotransferase n=1 Tax=Methyloligella halotolerans TaxID=1177755 RepID=A0A1E2RVY3_9HYPH|nr:6-phosphofructokinase [Methyloligella halotolerans]ODA66322.1 Pyrophosphate--fructose 6-phosphate 1-phosphotransferase [Methyloligella halotolerans]
MADLISGNAAIGQSGGPTAVINQSLVGVIEGLKAGLVGSGQVKKILGMRHGVRGLIAEGDDGLVDLSAMDQAKLEAIARAPSSALGSTRDKPDEAYCERILEGCKRHDIRYFFYIGGNDSADTCRIVSEKAAEAGYEMRCFHVPKTIDNDLKENDHTPGFPSAARFVTMAFMGDSMDNASLDGIKINVIMGRHAGFLTAAAALARGESREAEEPSRYHAAHLIYLPEVPFSTERFLADVDAVYSRLGRCQIAVSEGICNEKGEEIGPQLAANAERDAHGNIQLSGTGALGDGLSDLVKKGLTPEGGKAPRVRADTFGYLQRCWPVPSTVDAEEARAVGRHAAELAAKGESHASVILVRSGNGTGYRSACSQTNLSNVARHTRHMPAEFISGSNDVTEAFYDYCEPLVGELPRFGRL